MDEEIVIRKKYLIQVKINRKFYTVLSTIKKARIASCIGCFLFGSFVISFEVDYITGRVGEEAGDNSLLYQALHFLITKVFILSTVFPLVFFFNLCLCQPYFVLPFRTWELSVNSY